MQQFRRHQVCKGQTRRWCEHIAFPLVYETNLKSSAQGEFFTEVTEMAQNITFFHYIILPYFFSTTTLENLSSPDIAGLGSQQNEVQILPLFPTHPCLPVLLRSH